MGFHDQQKSWSVPLISHFLSYLQNYKEFKAKTLDLQPEKYGLSFDIEKCTTSGWALGDENVIGIRASEFIVVKFKQIFCFFIHLVTWRRNCQMQQNIIVKFLHYFALAAVCGPPADLRNEC